jgi:molybdopterin molybdotransferase
MPAGADTVVIQEITARDGDKVTMQKPTTTGRNVRRQGIDFSQGQVLLRKGRRLTDRDVMLAAAMNHAALPVRRRPKVALLGTGDELVAPGTAPKPGEIVYSNGFALMALARSAGTEVHDLGIARDRIEDIAEAVRKARDGGADVLVTTGGASVGEHDLVQRALRAEGLDLSFWRVALRPGRPMLHGHLGAMHVLGVPGNPVSAYVCAFLFLLPLLARLTGESATDRIAEKALLGRDLPANDERQDYLRATLTLSPVGPVATPLPDQDSSLMAPLSAADCLVIREPFAPAASSGSPCVILKLAL